MKITKQLDSILSDIDGKSLDELIQWANDQKKQYFEYEKLYLDLDQYGDPPILSLYGIREENGMELQARLAKKKNREALNKTERRKLWQQLNEEFANENI